MVIDRFIKTMLGLDINHLLEGNPMKGVGSVPAPWAVSDDTPRVGAQSRRRREPIGDEESRSQMRGTGRNSMMTIYRRGR